MLINNVPYKVSMLGNKCVVKVNTVPTQRTNAKEFLLNSIDKTVHYAVPYSGGIDSECVVELLKDAGATFTAYTMDIYVDGKHMNSYDTDYAKEYCKEHNINHVIVDVNLNHFLDELLYQYATEYACKSPQLSLHLWLFDQIPKDEVLFVPGDPITLIKRIRFKDYKYLYTTRYFNKTGRDHAQLMDGSSVMFNEILFYKIAHPVSDTDTYDYKCKLYKHLGFDAKPKPDKYTGFEKVRQYYSDKYNEQFTIREFNNRYRLPLEAIIPEPDMTYIYPKYMNEMIERFRNV